MALPAGQGSGDGDQIRKGEKCSENDQDERRQLEVPNPWSTPTPTLTLEPSAPFDLVLPDEEAGYPPER